jgi:hypothetical protein
MESVVVNDFGVMLVQTGERLVVRGARPRLDLVDGGPQLWLPLDLARGVRFVWSLRAAPRNLRARWGHTARRSFVPR